MFHQLLLKKRVTRIRLLSLDTQANFYARFPFIGKFRVCEHDMSCALEINNNGGIKRGFGILLFNHYQSASGHQIWQAGALP